MESANAVSQRKVSSEPAPRQVAKPPDDERNEAKRSNESKEDSSKAARAPEQSGQKVDVEA